MKTLVLLALLPLNLFAATSTIKFTAQTNAPGNSVSVEGEVKNAQVGVNFLKLDATKISFDVMDLVTGMDRRDKHLHEKVFNATAPGMAKIEYTTTKFTCPAETAPKIECESVGNLKIKDVSNEVKFKVQLSKADQVAEGKTNISLSQFKLTAPSFMGITVLDSVEVTFKVSAK